MTEFNTKPLGITVVFQILVSLTTLLAFLGWNQEGRLVIRSLVIRKVLQPLPYEDVWNNDCVPIAAIRIAHILGIWHLPAE